MSEKKLYDRTVCFGKAFQYILPVAKLPGYKTDEDRIFFLRERFRLEMVLARGDDAFLTNTISKLIDRAPPKEIFDFASR